jgi:hypothetical protein
MRILAAVLLASVRKSTRGSTFVCAAHLTAEFVLSADATTGATFDSDAVSWRRRES